MSVEPAPKIFLQNKLGRCRAKLTELSPLLEEKREHRKRLDDTGLNFSVRKGVRAAGKETLCVQRGSHGGKY